MQLPTTTLPPETKDPHILLLYGPPKHGKTSVISKLPGCCILDLEEGSKYVSAIKIPIANKEELKTTCALIKTQRPYKYVAIDTIDKVEEWAEIEATAKYKQSLQGKAFQGASVLQLPMGGGYMWLRQSFNDYLMMLSKIAPHIILIGHIRDKMIEAAGKEVSAKDLDLTGKIKSIVCAKADAIGYLSRSQAKPSALTFNFETSETVLCGSRCDHLKGKKFEFDGLDNFDWSKIYTELKQPESIRTATVE